MKRISTIRCMAALAIFLTPALLFAAERKKPLIKLTKPSYDPDAESVELFAGIESGKIKVQVILKNSKKATVLIHNITKKPLNVKLPDAFVAVLAQGPFGGGDDFGGGGGGQNQQFGGGQFGGGGQQGGGFFNVPAERVGAVKVAGVCLEHGKKEPRPSVKYVIKPVEVFSKDPVLKEMLTLFSQNRINQRVAQAAAWHIASKMSWQQLAAKRIKRLGQSDRPYFNQRELFYAVRLVNAAKAAVQNPSKSPSKLSSPGERLSLRN